MTVSIVGGLSKVLVDRIGHQLFICKYPKDFKTHRSKSTVIDWMMLSAYQMFSDDAVRALH